MSREKLSLVFATAILAVVGLAFLVVLLAPQFQSPHVAASNLGLPDVSAAIANPKAFYGKDIVVQGTIVAIHRSDALAYRIQIPQGQTIAALDTRYRYDSFRIGDRVQIIGRLMTSWDAATKSLVPLVEISYMRALPD